MSAEQVISAPIAEGEPTPQLLAPAELIPGASHVLSVASKVGSVGHGWPGLHRALGARPWYRSALVIEAAGALSAGLACALLDERLPAVAVTGLGVWAVSTYHRGYTAVSPLQSSFAGPARALALVMTLGATLTTLGVIGRASLGGMLLATTCAAAVSVAARMLRRTWRPVRTLIVGEVEPAADFAEQLSGASSSQIVGTCLIGPAPSMEDGGSAQGEILAKVDRAIGRYRADSVVLVPGGRLSGSVLNRLTWRLERLPVHVAITQCANAIAPHRVRPAQVGGCTVLEVEPSRRSALVRAAKAVLDRLLGAVLLVIAAPVIGLLALLVRVDSRGPGIFRQARVGRDGREFTMYKLRTMCSDAEQLRVPLQRQHEEQMLFKLADDPRVTRVGRLLRRSSLDELPQLFNVVKGDMSLIGPRPALPEEVAKYDDRARRRLALRPGLTGLWQVSGRSDLNWDESLGLDLHYVDNWRLADDAMILARTARAVIASRGAY